MVVAYMVNSTTNGGQAIFDGGFVDGLPDTSSTHVSQALVGLDAHLVKVAREIYNYTIFNRRGTCGIVTPALDGNWETALLCILDSDGNVFGILDKDDDSGVASGIGGPPSDSRLVVGAV